MRADPHAAANLHARRAAALLPLLVKVDAANAVSGAELVHREGGLRSTRGASALSLSTSLAEIR